jgi:molybdate transport system ATP-binding protein
MTIEASLAHRFPHFSIDVTFRADRRGVTALFGPSGSGKTTIVNAIAGLLRPERGRIVLDGEILLDTEAHIFVPARRRRMGYVFQDARLFPHLSVEGNLLFGARRAETRASLSQFQQIADLLGLRPLLGRKPAKLSGGEKSRVALGRALLAGPRMLLLDEPLAALDRGRKLEILPYLERLRDFSGVPMIYVTHSAEEVARLADDVIVVHNGRIATQGSVFDLLSDPGLDPLVPPDGGVFPAIIAEHRADGLTALLFDGGVLLVPRLDRPLQAKLRVRIRADDVILARAHPQAISANNILSAEVLGAPTQHGTHTDVRLRCGGVKFMARITHASFSRLSLRDGDAVFAIVKSIAMDPDSRANRNETD